MIIGDTEIEQAKTILKKCAEITKATTDVFPYTIDFYVGLCVVADENNYDRDSFARVQGEAIIKLANEGYFTNLDFDKEDSGEVNNE